MRRIIAIVFLVGCGGEGPVPQPTPKPTPKVNVPQVPDLYCGDFVCDELLGETKYNCVDCGYDPFTDCPRDGGNCGDGVCCGGESARSCWDDCKPVPFKPKDPRDPGWIDPIPEI